MKMQLVDHALMHYKQLLEINRNILLDKRKNSDFADTLNNVGTCLIKKRFYDDALNRLETIT